MRIVCVSDTHCRHFRKLDLPKGDALVHAGDLCLNGNMTELDLGIAHITESVDRAGGFKYIILIGGNHDFVFQEHNAEARRLLDRSGIIYLQDEEVTLDGLKFYGSPWTPTFLQWAFMRERGAEIRAEWDKIPRDTDVLITHGPPKDILDQTVVWNDMVGDEELRKVVFELPQLKLHIFGHIHEGYGQWMDMSGKERPVHFVNASRVNAAYSPVNDPIVVEL